MIDLPNQITSSTETPERKSLYRLLTVVFVVFLIIGSLIGYATSSKLNKNEPNSNESTEVQTTAPATYQGIVTYLGEDMYSNDGVTFSLTDSRGEDIILLKSSDQKLSIAQGLFVTVVGKKGTTIDGKNDVLEVTEVTIKNGSN